jgi:hypothetical protein
MRFHLLFISMFFCAMLTAFALQAQSITPLSEKTENITYFSTMGQSIYVPVYSHVYVLGKKKRLLETTLSIRNTDSENEIIIKSVKYYNTEGQEVESYLSTPYTLNPLATTEFIVEQNDSRGGSGANFIVKWQAKKKVIKPIVEAVMIGISGTQAISLIRSGHVIEEYDN